MGMTYDEGIKALNALSTSLGEKMETDGEKVSVYTKNQEQVKKLEELKGKLQDPKDKNKGIIPMVQNATNYAVTNNPEGLIRSGMQAYAAKEAIKGLKDYVKSAKGKLKEILVSVLYGLYVQAENAAKTVKTVANTPVMAPQVDSALKAYHSVVDR